MQYLVKTAAGLCYAFCLRLMGRRVCRSAPLSPKGDTSPLKGRHPCDPAMSVGQPLCHLKVTPPRLRGDHPLKKWS